MSKLTLDDKLARFQRSVAELNHNPSRWNSALTRRQSNSCWNAILHKRAEEKEVFGIEEGVRRFVAICDEAVRSTASVAGRSHIAQDIFEQRSFAQTFLDEGGNTLDAVLTRHYGAKAADAARRG